MDHLKLFSEKLPVENIIPVLKSSAYANISLFVGKDADNCAGSNTIMYDYKGDEFETALSLQNMCSNVREMWPSIGHIVIYQRLGLIPIHEANFAVGISSDGNEVLEAINWCRNALQTCLPILKNEVSTTPKLTFNTGDKPTIKFFKANVQPEVKPDPIGLHLIQIRASSEEINERIEKFMQRKREEINRNNIRDFCQRVPMEEDCEFSCARIDSVLLKRKDSVGHLQVDRVLNNYNRDQNNMDYMMQHMPQNGVEERLKNLEFQLSMDKPVPTNVYHRIKSLEDRLLHLESISPEYQQFWRKNAPPNTATVKRKKIFSLDELDSMMNDLTKRQKFM